MDINKLIDVLKIVQKDVHAYVHGGIGESSEFTNDNWLLNLYDFISKYGDNGMRLLKRFSLKFLNSYDCSYQYYGFIAHDSYIPMLKNDIEELALFKKSILNRNLPISDLYDEKKENALLDLIDSHLARLNNMLLQCQKIIKVPRKANKKILLDEVTGDVYVLKDGDLFKIGYSKNVGERVQQHRISNQKFEIIGTFPSSRNDEKILHKHFRHKRIESEWFKLDTTDLLHIETYFKSRN